MSAAVAEKTEPLLKLDIGCGTRKKAGFWGVDSRQFEGVDQVADICKPWPWADNSAEEIHAGHVLEHLTNLNDKWERVHFFNEAYRVLIDQGKLTISIPHWASNRYYGDPTHKEPFSEMGFYYLDRDWRSKEAPHVDLYTCHFHCTWGYALNPALISRNAEYQQHAIAFWKEACSDMIATCVAHKK